MDRVCFKLWDGVGMRVGLVTESSSSSSSSPLVRAVGELGNASVLGGKGVGGGGRGAKGSSKGEGSVSIGRESESHSGAGRSTYSSSFGSTKGFKTSQLGREVSGLLEMLSRGRTRES